MIELRKHWNDIIVITLRLLLGYLMQLGLRGSKQIELRFYIGSEIKRGHCIKRFNRLALFSLPFWSGSFGTLKLISLERYLNRHLDDISVKN
jgi:hypothetical protein